MHERVVVMGAAGAGKTVVGETLATRLDARFVDADDLHPSTNVAKMRRGTPLTDADRDPWLGLVAAELGGAPPVIVACSALARRYRDRLRDSTDRPLWFVHLDVGRAVLAERIDARRSHFMPSSLLDDQLATLEGLAGDEHGLTVDGSLPLDQVVRTVVRSLRP